MRRAHSPGTALRTGPGHSPKKQKSVLGPQTPGRSEMQNAVAFVGNQTTRTDQKSPPPPNEGGRTIRTTLTTKIVRGRHGTSRSSQARTNDDGDDWLLDFVDIEASTALRKLR